jgi:hypothetical protein
MKGSASSVILPHQLRGGIVTSVLQKKAPAGEDRRALPTSEGLKSGQSPAGATMMLLT